MYSSNHIKPYRDQALFRDLGFLVLATGFLLVKVFEHSLSEALVYAPLIVAGIFVALLVTTHVLLGMLSLIEAITHRRLGKKREPRR